MLLYDDCHTRIGCLRFIFKEDGQLVRIMLTDDYWDALMANHKLKRSYELGKSVCRQFKEYIHGNRRQFDVPFTLEGTPFQKQVWETLREIPYGEIRTYSKVAISIGKPKAIRAVGHANAVNPLPILIPCHRVIGKNNKLTGYAGGVDMKRQLLEIEDTKKPGGATVKAFS
ncbi:methylated-DNA--[protein]-cysteine S-methyltransferase [Virgibacillus siamensis]|uniref:methylated-DNA--[protein]-cysteine S-methyltransferase n=1 Tax=Virgibacillus siamensis TaxID=480071 RepID=UPI001FE7E0C9|nr:methylated-DNA--[protein]-cysteine S-methyltransferase [Virgibacillus siamensis]